MEREREGDEEGTYQPPPPSAPPPNGTTKHIGLTQFKIF